MVETGLEHGRTPEIFSFAIASKCSVTFANMLVTDNVFQLLITSYQSEHWSSPRMVNIPSVENFDRFDLKVGNFLSQYSDCLLLRNAAKSLSFFTSQKHNNPFSKKSFLLYPKMQPDFAIIRSWKWVMIGMHSLGKAMKQNCAKEDLSKYSDWGKKGLQSEISWVVGDGAQTWIIGVERFEQIHYIIKRMLRRQQKWCSNSLCLFMKRLQTFKSKG